MRGGADVEVLVPGLEGSDLDVGVLGGVQREVGDEFLQHVRAHGGDYGRGVHSCGRRRGRVKH